ncbi:hypothetical protein ASPBRDRAFT_212009 [Aspergillus brasiliensis CBS 101740]|uniref:CRAL-TRIO domain-containing protein n=1 Tax=Aspergillus brasiliensis (strain CBS 101740 / IMI 381727 / IBT 21946) TaxID=767769 RepID=A0A1L9U259_ASPBC|nr:hypothetical protein ASPBRDRAFT_212009 [Aspergillus brasiliensis CBS 101740]
MELSPGETVQLEKFKELLLQHGYVLSSVREGTDDTTLLRYLRAQKFDTVLAFGQFHFAQTWRKEHHIREFYEEVEVSFYENSRRMYPQWTGRRDMDGRPVYVFPVRHLTKGKLKAYLKRLESCPTAKSYDLSPADLHFHALYENLLQFVFPLASQLSHPQASRPISASTHIIDVSGVSVRQFWGIRKYLQEASVAATTHYPETLGRVFVVGAPAFFKSIWEVISQWFDPVTRSKIFFLSADETHEVLRSYIDESDLPVVYGGQLDWEWQDLPKLDEPAQRLVNHIYESSEQAPVVPEGPVIFESGCFQFLGSVNGKLRRNALCLARDSSLSPLGSGRAN